MAKSTQATGWVGWVYFTGLLLILTGLFQAIAGIAALFKDQTFAITSDHLLVLDYTQWGWIHLFLGFLLAITGIALFSGKTWAIVMGVILASASALSQFAFLNASPVWSVVIMVIDFVIIYALIVHGKEVQLDD